MGRKNKKKTGEEKKEGTGPALQEIPSPTSVTAGNIPVIPQDQPGPSGAGDVQSVTEEVQELSVEGSGTPVGQGKKGRSRRRKGGSTLPQDQQQALSQASEQIVSQDPQQIMPQAQPQWRPQTPQQTIMQGPLQAMPQGQLQSAPQGQPQWRPQGLLQTVPQGRPQGRPHGQQQLATPQETPQGQQQATPQGQQQATPQGQQLATPQGQQQATPQGQQQATPQGQQQATPQGRPQGQQQATPQGRPQGQKQATPQGQQQATPQGQQQATPQGQQQATPQGQQQATPQGRPQGQQQATPQGRPQGQKQATPQGQQQATPQGRPQGQQQATPQGRPQGPLQTMSQGQPQGSHKGHPQGQQQTTPQRPVQSVQSNIVSGELQVPKRDVKTSGPKTGRKILIEVNYFPLNIAPKAQGYHYDVTIEPDVKKLKFKVMQLFFEQYFPGRHPVFDGMKNMYSCGALDNMPSGELSGQVEYNEPNRAKPCIFKVHIKKVANINFQSLMLSYMKTGSSNNAPQAAIQCVDVVLRYGALCHYVKVGRSVFSPPTGRVVSLGGGLEMWHGSFQSATLKWKPLLNFDIAHKGFPKGQNVVDLIVELLSFDKNNQKVKLRSNEVADLEKFIKTLRVEFKIPGQSASRRTCTVNGVVETPGEIHFNLDGRNMTVLSYFNNVKHYTVKYPNLPCLRVGSKNSEIKVCYPVELCTIVGGQAVRRKLDGRQTSEMIKQSTVKADERKRKIMDAFQAMEFGRDGALKEFGLSVGTQFEKVQGRVIPPPVLQYSGESKVPEKGKWYGGKFKSGAELMNWVVLSVCRVDAKKVNSMVDLLISAGKDSGMNISRPEMKLMEDTGALQEEIMKAARNKIQLVMVIFDGYTKDAYSKIKQFAELNYGVLTQCIKNVTVKKKMNYATANQLLLKINSKLNQINHSLDTKPKCLTQPCMIMGADVTHPPPGHQGEEPSIAAVVASHCPVAFKYNITLRLQPSKAEMIDDLRSMVKEQLLFFYKQTGCKPLHLIMFRDGVSDGQFEQVLNIELTAIRAACTDLGAGYKPAITYLVVQKRHHTRFFPTNPRDGDSNMNVPVGTCIDTNITHPTEFDFYLLSHASIQGMARPTRYYKLWDDAGMTDTEIEELAFHLCHMYTRCNRSVSYPAPTYYAHLAAARAKVLTEDRKINMNDLQAEQDKIKVVDTILKGRPMFFV